MMFTFVYTGWEGTTNDSRIFYDAVTRPKNEFPTALDGSIFLFTPLTHIISNIYVLFTPTNTYPEFVSLYARYFYLVDSGFPYTNGYLPPYRRERFNWQDFWASGDPRGFKELFNHHHLSLQMVIECCFGVLNFFSMYYEACQGTKFVGNPLFLTHVAPCTTSSTWLIAVMHFLFISSWGAWQWWWLQ
jgi:hypothetical protein